MLSFIKKVEIYEIKVDPCTSIQWTEKFNFKPNTEDVATAIRQEISELDPDVEHEADMIQDLKQTLELVTFTGPELLGKVSCAGTYLGEISIAIIRIFAKEEPSMMPKLSSDLVNRVPEYSQYGNPCGEIPGPESTSPIPNLTDTSEVPTEDHGEDF